MHLYKHSFAYQIVYRPDRTKRKKIVSAPNFPCKMRRKFHAHLMLCEYAILIIQSFMVTVLWQKQKYLQSANEE